MKVVLAAGNCASRQKMRDSVLSILIQVINSPPGSERHSIIPVHEHHFKYFWFCFLLFITINCVVTQCCALFPHYCLSLSCNVTLSLCLLLQLLNFLMEIRLRFNNSILDPVNDVETKRAKKSKGS